MTNDELFSGAVLARFEYQVFENGENTMQLRLRQDPRGSAVQWQLRDKYNGGPEIVVDSVTASTIVMLYKAPQLELVVSPARPAR